MPDVHPATARGDAPTARPDGFASWLDARRKLVDEAIESHLATLSRGESLPGRLSEAVAYSLSLPGKRLRPILVLESCRVVGGPETVALPVALAVECVHTFSLIHDDLPAMDDDRLRRGRPTNHTVFGEAEAILAGDWLVPHAFGLLASNPVPTEIVPQLIRTLADATEAMILGQSADIASEGRPPDQQTVRVIHTHKTAAMMEAACRLGALVGGGTTEAVDALAEYGRRLGLAFQIVDDLLDRTATAEAVGKQTGKDEAVAKQTWPAAHGVHASRAHAREQIAEAIDSLQPFGGAAENLRRIAGFVIERGR